MDVNSKARWTQDLCLVEAKKYKSRTEFKNGSRGAYKSACHNKWIDDSCSHMIVISKAYWTKELCLEEAKKYKTRTEFRNGSGGAYKAACYNKWIDDSCALMLDKHKPSGYWTEERCTEEAKKFKTRSEFKKLSSSAFTKARKSGWIDDICTHMREGRKPNGYWTKERCAEEASKFKTRGAFHKLSGAAYVLASQNDWIDDICTHMREGRKPNGYWTKERCATEASKFKTRVEFKKGSISAYSKAGSNGWLDEICLNMERIGNILNRAIYLIANERLKEAYIGLTGNLVVRKKQHFSKQGNSTNSRKITEKTDTYFKSLTEYVSAEEAILLEEYFVKEYRCMGYLILNDESAIGGLGGGKLKWGKDSCQSEASNYTSRKEFESGNTSAYNSARKNNWMDDICAHMANNQKPSGYWTKERCATEAKKYNTRAEFRINSSSAYSKALKSKWIDDICAHMIEIRKPNGYWSKERCAEEASKFKTRADFKRGNSAAYSRALKSKWIDEVCIHMEKNRK
jgi:predicted GIY-YIG superfamily endonuclease